MKITTVSVGEYGTNCYIAVDEESGEAAAVDCAVFDADYRFALESAGVTKLKYILLTHGHFDHVCGVKFLKDACGGEICIHEEDKESLTDEKASLNEYTHYSVQESVEPDRILTDGDRLFLGKTGFTVRHTPGHTRGSVCFLTDDGVMFSGDTLFYRSMGRTDLPGGSTKTIFRSLEGLGRIEEEYVVLPGHGEKTLLSDEKKYNRYLRAR